MKNKLIIVGASVFGFSLFWLVGTSYSISQIPNLDPNDNWNCKTLQETYDNINKSWFEPTKINQEIKQRQQDLGCDIKESIN